MTKRDNRTKRIQVYITPQTRRVILSLMADELKKGNNVTLNGYINDHIIEPFIETNYKEIPKEEVHSN